MAEWTVRVDQLSVLAQTMEQCAHTLQEIGSNVNMVRGSLQFRLRNGAVLDRNLQALCQQIEQEAKKSANMTNGMRSAAQAYSKTENKLCANEGAEAATAKKIYYIKDDPTWWDKIIYWVKDLLGWESYTEYEIDSIVFDEEGSYGGDQGSAQNQIFARKHELYATIRQYYPDYTDEEASAFLKKLNSEGCGYVAIINTIFAAYVGRADEFERTFGFPLYAENGDLNYDRLLVDFYAATDNHNKDFWGRDYIDYQEDRSEKEKGSDYNYREDKNGRGTFQSDWDYRTKLYLEQKGVPVSVTTNYPVKISNFRDLSENGYVVIAYYYGNLQRENGSIASYIDGGHAMVVTGVTEDGRYIVSSWGEKYYIDPDEIVDNNGKKTSFTFSYFQYN